MSDVTRILSAIENGEAAATSELLPLVYDELRRIAAHKMSAESANHTLQPTALVHEAWLRLVGTDDRQWQTRAPSFRAAADATRRSHDDHAPRKLSQKRGSGLPAEELYESALVLNAPPDELLAVSEALDTLAKQDPEAAQLVKLRFFVGMTMEESAAAMNIATRTAERVWTYARVWLRNEIRKPI